MHNIEMIGAGRFCGWAAAGRDGSPERLKLELNRQEAYVYAIRSRQDVLDAGHSLFSGFDLHLSGEPGLMNCVISVDGEVHEVSLQPLQTSKLIVMKQPSAQAVNGWVHGASGLRSLVLCHSRGTTRAKIVERSDAVEALGPEKSLIHEFTAHDVDARTVYAVVINNTHIHWIGPDERLGRTY